MTSDHFVLQKNHSTLQYTIHVISDCVIMSPPFYFLYWIVDICSKMGPLNLSWAAPLVLYSPKGTFVVVMCIYL